VAAYLRRDVSTVQRWERREGLPVHRHFHDRQGSIYAFRHELDAWQRNRQRQPRLVGFEGETTREGPDLAPVLAAAATPQRPSALMSPLTVAAMVVFAVAGVAMVTLGDASTGATPRERPRISSLVVLPLENLSANAGDAYLAAGLTDELTSRLAELHELRVVSRTSAIALHTRRASLPSIARELRVDGAIQGSLRHHNGRVAISVQLIHAPTDTHLWTGDFEQDAADVLKLQRDISRAVAEEVRVHISQEERARLAAEPVVNPKAHEAYLLGRYLLWKFIEDDRLRAMQHFQRAIAIDPNYAAPYAGLAHAWWMRGVMGPLSLAEVAEPARNAARAALARDGRLSEAHAALAYVQGMFDWDWHTAEATIQRAIQLQPNSVETRYVYSLLLMATGRLPAAIFQIERAAELDPLSAQVQSTFGRVLYRARRYDEAADRLTRAIELEPRNAGTRLRLADVYSHMGRYEEALEGYQQAHSMIARPTGHRARSARTYALMGRTHEARALLKRTPAPAQAAVHVALGDHDAAFALMTRAIDAREEWLLFIKADPDFDGLREDPRWSGLLERMRLNTN
jgi:TolB-like protein/Tfp pilus assembly protein PilF